MVQLIQVAHNMRYPEYAVMDGGDHTWQIRADAFGDRAARTLYQINYLLMASPTEYSNDSNYEDFDTHPKRPTEFSYNTLAAGLGFTGNIFADEIDGFHAFSYGAVDRDWETKSS